MKKLNSAISILLCAVIALSTLAYGTVHQPTIALFYLTVAAICILWAVECFMRRELAFSRSAVQIPLIAAVAYSIIQIIPFGTAVNGTGLDGISRQISVSPYDTGQTAIQFASIAIFLALLLVYLNSAKRLEKVINFLLIFGFAYAFFAVLQSFLSPTKIYGIYERPTPFGTFVNRHNFAAYMEMMIALPLGMLLSGAVARDKKLLYVTGIAMMGLALLLSGSRGGMISILAAVILLLVLTSRAKGTKKIILRAGLAIVMIGVIVGGVVLIGGESALSRVADTAKAGDISTDRTRIWAITGKVIAANMPFGAGFGAFAQAYTPFDSFNGLERVEQAHNDYLQMLADAGIAGLLIGAFFLFSIYRAATKGIAEKNGFRRGIAFGALAAIFAVLVHSLFDFVLHTTAVALLFVMMIALLTASGRTMNDDIQTFDDDRRVRRKKATVTAIDGDTSKVRIGRG